MKRLQELRKAAGYTQSDVAKKLGISRQAYSNYELGNREPDYKNLVSLSDLFSVSIDYLLGKDEPPQLEESPAQKFVAALPLDLLTDDELEKLVEYAEFLVSQRKKKE